MQIRDVLTVVVLCGSLVFWAGGSWAQETTSVSDETASASEETVPMEMPVLPVPKIEYTLNGNEVLIIISGIDEVAIKGFLFNGSDITQLVSDMIASGAMIKEVNDAGNITGLRFSVDNPLSLEGATLGVVLDTNTVLSNQIHFESQDKWFAPVAVPIVLSAATSVASVYFFSPGEKKIEYITGTVKDVNTGCKWFAQWEEPCRTLAPDGTKVSLYIWERRGGKEDWSKEPVSETNVGRIQKGIYHFGTITTPDGKYYCGPVRVEVTPWYSLNWDLIKPVPGNGINKKTKMPVVVNSIQDPCWRVNGWKTSLDLTAYVNVPIL